MTSIVALEHFYDHKVIVKSAEMHVHCAWVHSHGLFELHHSIPYG
jgi:hypothetical protein